MTLEQRVANLEKMLLQMQKNLTPVVSKTDENSNNIISLIPYTETKIGYYGETEKTFYNVPEGNVTVLGLTEYTLNRISNRLILTFSALTEQTNITISIM